VISVSFNLDGKDGMIIKKTVERFIANATRSGSQQLKTSDQSFTNTLGQNMFSRLTEHIPTGVTVKKMFV